MEKKTISALAIGAMLGATGVELSKYPGPKAIAIEKSTTPSLTNNENCLTNISTEIASSNVSCKNILIEIDGSFEERWVCNNKALSTQSNGCFNGVANSIIPKTSSCECNQSEIEVDNKKKEFHWLCSCIGLIEKSLDDLEPGDKTVIIKK